MNYIFALRDGAFLGILFLLSRLDLSIRKIPDRILLVAVINYGLAAMLLRLPVRMVLWRLAAGVTLGIGLLLVTLVAETLLKKKGFGGGDIKLLCVVSLYLGFWHTLYALAIACTLELLSLLFAGKKGEAISFPFAPAITAGVSFVLCIWKS